MSSSSDKPTSPPDDTGALPDFGVPLPGARLVARLERAQGRGLVGPGAVSEHVSHALGFVRAWEAVAGPGAFTGAGVDLGSGGGLPGLVLALAWPESAWVLLDSHQRAVTFLEETVGELGLAGRVDIVRARAEEYGRGDGRGRAALVVARGFGAPAVTAECAAPLLAVGGRLVVSEPPEAEDRWPADGLAPLGLRPERLVNIGARFQVLVQGEPCPVAYPRRTGVPSKRPLF